MSTTPGEPAAPTLEERVSGLEQALDSTLTANAVLQERYGLLQDQYNALTARIEALEA